MKSDRIFPEIDWFPRPVGSVQFGNLVVNPEMQKLHDMLRERVRAFIDNQEGENERVIQQELIRAGWTPPPGSDMGNPTSGHKLNADQTVAVATDVYFNPDMSAAPRGVKLQLIGEGGVAVYATYHGDPFWKEWAPVPKRRKP